MVMPAAVLVLLSAPLTRRCATGGVDDDPAPLVRSAEAELLRLKTANSPRWSCPLRAGGDVPPDPRLAVETDESAPRSRR